MKRYQLLLGSFAALTGALLSGCQSGSNSTASGAGYGVPDNPYTSFPADGSGRPYPQSEDYVDVAPVQPRDTFRAPSYDSAPTRTPPASSGSGQSYTVVRGDTLYSISKRHNTTVSSIKSLNGLSSDRIYPGDVLNLP